MHEWALAEAIVLTLEKAAKDRGVDRIQHVKISLGELQAIDREVFEFALRTLLDELRNKGIEVENYEISEEKALFRCRRCGYSWSLDQIDLSENEKEAIHFVPEAVHVYMSCPKCGSKDFEVVRGRGVYIHEIVF